MRVFIRSIRNYFFSAFREIFVYHHTSLEFRAKLYALMIASTNEPFRHYFQTLEDIAKDIYGESDRAGALVLTVKEYVNAVHTKKTFSDQKLLYEIIQELRIVPRYALKIEPNHLRQLQECTEDNDSRIYQERLIEFLSQKRADHSKP